MRLPGDTGPNDWYTRSSVTYRIGGQVYVDPPPHVLAKMRTGDVVYLAPKGAKCDQWGTCWGTEPVVLPYHDSELNPAKWLKDMETQWPCGAEQREYVALFSRHDGTPFPDSVFSSLIHSVLEQVVGRERARLYSPHSWRVWLASALRVLGAPDALIQAFGRWMNPESLKIYSRMTSTEYTTWMDKVMSVKSLDATRVTNLPIMDTIDMVREWQQHHAMALFDADASTKARPPPGTAPHTLATFTVLDPATPLRPNEASRKRGRSSDAHTEAPQRRRASRDVSSRTRPHHRERYSDAMVGRLTSTTTGVGSLAHAFPDTLNEYRTYNDRASTRRGPTVRVRT